MNRKVIIENCELSATAQQMVIDDILEVYRGYKLISIERVVLLNSSRISIMFIFDTSSSTKMSDSLLMEANNNKLY